MSTGIRVGDCVVRPQRRLIERGDDSVHVTPRAMSVLECLVAAGGAPVSRNDLFEQVWRGAEVSDDALTKCIGELRRAFCDSAREPRVIETIPKLGFRLIPPVEPLDEEPSQARPETIRPQTARPGAALPEGAVPDLSAVEPDTLVAAPPPRPRKWRLAMLLATLVLVSGLLLAFAGPRAWLTEAGVTLFIKAASILSPVRPERAPVVAVLPFLNLSSDADNDYFSDGISMEIINALARTGRLPVIARSSSFQFRGADLDVREIGRRLGVSHVLEGSVRRAGDSIRLTAQLSDTGLGQLVWSEVYQRDLSDIFALQQEVAADIVGQVYVALGYGPAVLRAEPVDFGTRRGTANPEAYELYLQGVALLNSDRPPLIDQAPAYFDRAIALDGDYADAWAMKGYALAVLGHFQWGASHIPASVYPESIAAFRKALEIEPRHAFATGYLGVLLMQNDFQWAEGMRLLEQGVTMNPNDAEMLSVYGFYLDTMHLPGAGEVLERAYRLDPFKIETMANLAVYLNRKGRRLEAAALAETILTQDPEGYAANVYAARLNLGLGRLDYAEERLRKARQVANPIDLNLDAMQWLIDYSRGKGWPPWVEVWERMQSENLSNAVLYRELDVDAEAIVALFELAIEQRQPALRSALFGPRPRAMPEAEWRRFKEITGVTRFQKSLGE
jgi:TolB-like protein/DNA-binding winged helix-turn-helix (wHTH) protein